MTRASADLACMKPFSLGAAMVLVAGACSVAPAWQSIASQAGFETGRVDSARFQHVVIGNRVPGRHLRIYIEGDGTPWIRSTRVAIDPTPRDPLLLRLMSDDTGPALYLGRPCYFGLATSPGCHPRFWTRDRYAAPVIHSMCESANQLALRRTAKTVELIGYSGGGAIAVRMRSCVANLAAITTIAGNLDVDAWARHHRYSPLADDGILLRASGSANRVMERHWQCRHDESVPPETTDAYFATHPSAERILVGDCSHAEGWARYSHRILSRSD